MPGLWPFHLSSLVSYACEAIVPGILPSLHIFERSKTARQVCRAVRLFQTTSSDLRIARRVCRAVWLSRTSSNSGLISAARQLRRFYINISGDCAARRVRRVSIPSDQKWRLCCKTSVSGFNTFSPKTSVSSL